MLTSSMAKADSGLYVLGPNRLEGIKQALRAYGGYELITDLAGRRILREIKGAQIPKAGASEYITVVVPDKYDITKGTKNPAQRVVPIDQPGLEDPPKPSSTKPTPSQESSPSVTEERPTPRKPVIETKAELADEAAFVIAGATVNDTVTYTDLVPGKEYTLEAQLVDKANASRVLGSGSTSFTADASGSGKVVVPIRVNDDVRSPVASAVAFETLKSSDREAQNNRAERLTDGSRPSGDVIADHKDINDTAQTVTSAELKSARIELKKYIGDQEFAGSEKPQSGAAGSPGVIDAQNVDTAYEAKKDQDLTVTFAVTNTGDLDLKNVRVSDQLITGEGFASSDLSAISPEKQDIAKGETKFFTATLKAPAAGKIHGDKAKADGVPVDEQGRETPYTDGDGNEREPGTPVESNEDPAYAKTPEPRKPEIATKAEFAEGVTRVKAGVTVNDTVTYTDVVPGKQYTLEAQLVDKADASKVLGTGSTSFTADESGSGEVLVPIAVSDDVEGSVAAAVAFETLKSSDKEAQENKAECLPEGSADDVIAEHKDINDEAQTVTSDEVKSARIELKKYIGDQEFSGSEKPQTGGFGSAGVIDAQDEASAYEAKQGQDLTVTFAVTNTGDLNLKDVKVSDELITGEGFESSELSSISPQKQDIAQGETKFFTATLKAPAAGKIHGDKAKADGVPVDDEGNETPYTDGEGKEREPGTPVESNEDPAHAKTPKPGEPKLELKKFINDNDAQTADEAEELKPGEKATVKFVVTNSGEVDLFNVTLSDETVAGVGDVVNIEPKQIDRLKVGESGEFIGELTLTEGGQDHKDVAKAEGVPPSPENPDEPGDVPPVPSNEDPAHVKTPKSKSAAIALKKYIGAKAENADSLSVEQAEALNDSQTEDAAHKASAADEDLTVAFVVENTGELTLKDIQLSDEAITQAFTNAVDGTEAGIDADTPQVTNIRVANFAGNAEKQKMLAASEKVVFVGDLKAPAAGKLHADKAKSTGTPVDEEGTPTSYVPVDDEGNPVEDGSGQPKVNEPGTSVESHEDQAHATSPEETEVESEPSTTPSEKPSETPVTTSVEPSDEPSEAPKPSKSKPVPEPSSSVPLESEEPSETVTEERPEPGEPRIELKKYINGDDAETKDAAVSLKPGDVCGDQYW
ncbi:VaFE repeat-containing surface-anchored protein [Corynebacterium mastitidis]|uniref:VaFE repeat-containing surface-anchored protein n=1 Tax=Corynebacterium mastitidis TaxID=161890 RepID=A0ABU8NXC1_9CORY